MTLKPADVVFRPARLDELPRIVELLADDALGRQRESDSMPLSPSYSAAFIAIARDPNNALIVADHDGTVVGLLQLTFIPSMTYSGSWRALIEGVRIARAMRGQKIGTALLQWAIAEARRRGCRIVQLTTDKSRPEALRFYESLGFRATHEGLKLQLE